MVVARNRICPQSQHRFPARLRTIPGAVAKRSDGSTGRCYTDRRRSPPAPGLWNLTAPEETDLLIHLQVNGSGYQVNVDPEMPLLWVLRDELGLAGTKYSCGIGICGSCTVLVDGVARRSCSVSVGEVSGAVTTIEGIGTPENLHIVQEEWIRHQVAQCGYCQSGQILSAVSLLSRNASPSDGEINTFLSDNLCRCGTYMRIRQAVKSAAERLKA